MIRKAGDDDAAPPLSSHAGVGIPALFGSLIWFVALNIEEYVNAYRGHVREVDGPTPSCPPNTPNRWIPTPALWLCRY